MTLPALVPAAEELALDSFTIDTDAVTIGAVTRRSAVPCPGCGTPTARVHSRYWRTLRDLPWQGTPVRIRLQTRRFFCVLEACPRRIFTERLPQTTAFYARSTLRFLGALRALALALGGEAGARLAQELALETSGDTLLRRLRHWVCTPRPPLAPRVLGVDEWAWKKGQRYGTILVDLEQGRVVDLLPDRSADSFADWLRDRPPVEVISRDRSKLYAEGARRGAPDAVQGAEVVGICCATSLRPSNRRCRDTLHCCERPSRPRRHRLPRNGSLKVPPRHQPRHHDRRRPSRRRREDERSVWHATPKRSSGASRASRWRPWHERSG